MQEENISVLKELKDAEASLGDWVQYDLNQFRKENFPIIMDFFKKSNIMVLLLIVISIAMDSTVNEKEQIFTERVLLACIAGTVAQLGAISFFMSKWLYSDPFIKEGNEPPSKDG